MKSKKNTNGGDAIPHTKKTKVTKDELVNALDDICGIFDFDDLDELDVSKATRQDIVQYIESKQSGDDAFVDSDFEISKKGKTSGLDPKTVSVLIKCGISVPECWKDRLKECNFQEGEKNTSMICDEEKEYAECLKEARDEDSKSTKKSTKSKKVEDSDLEDEESEKIARKDAEEEGEEIIEAPVEKKVCSEDIRIAKSAPKASKTPARGGRAIRLELYSKLFEKGTPKDIVIEKILDLGTGASISTIKTEISDFKNPKYNKLERLVVEENGKLIFQ